jgi:Leucine-rich repeat (LRR) protein
LTVIDLSHNNIESVPAWLFLLPHIRHIDLSHNNIANLPTQESFPASPHPPAPKLRNLSLGFNNFSHIPPLVSMFRGLEELDLSRLGSVAHDEWTSFELKYGSSFTYLNLSNNHLVMLPPFCCRDSLSLKYLKLSSNLLNSLPFEFSKLRNLVTLDLSDNRLTSLEHVNQNSHHNLVTLKASRNEVRCAQLILVCLCCSHHIRYKKKKTVCVFVSEFLKFINCFVVFFFVVSTLDKKKRYPKYRFSCWPLGRCNTWT